MLVFVYGTLKKGEGNHGVMEKSKGKFLGDHNTAPNYSMYSLGGFPAVVGGGKTSIRGEVYRINDLEYLDSLEGYPRMYGRVSIQTKFGDAWMYVYNGSVKGCTPIPSGIW